MKTLLCICLSLVFAATSSAQPEPDYGHPADGRSSFLTVQGFMISSIGQFEQAWTEAGGFYIGRGIVYDAHWALVYQAGYFSLTHNEEMNFSGDPAFTVIPLAIGGRYYIFSQRIRPFLLAMGGINIISEDYVLEDKDVKLTKGRLHFQVGGGLGVMISGQIELEISGKYNSHLLDPSAPYNMTGLEYGVAVSWHWN